MAPPELPVPEAEDAQDPVVRVQQEFLPPRLDESSRRSTADFAKRAGVPPGRSVRVILAVTVTEQGTAGDVQVSITSGDSRVDALAVEYARVLRWSPAIVQGRNASMNIRLPVVLAMPG